jgi:hypothetical protein
MKRTVLAFALIVACGSAAYAAAPKPMTPGESSADLFFTGRYMIFTALGVFGSLTGGALFLALGSEKRRMKKEIAVNNAKIKQYQSAQSRNGARRR